MKFTAKRKILKNGIKRCLGLFIVVFAQVMFTGVYAQSTNLTIQQKNITVKEVLTLIEKNSQIVFFYTDKDVDLNRRVSIDVKNRPAYDVLNQLFKNSANVFKTDGKQVYITKKSRPVEEKINSTGKKAKISGVVTDITGEPIIGAQIIVKGTKFATITDYTGKFYLDIPNQSTLAISYIGYIPMDIKVESDYVTVEMVEDAKKLDEVVVVGYGKQKKITSIGAQSSITAKDLQSQPVANISNAIAGRVAGIVGVQRSGEPGYDGSAIYIRGISTFTNSSPLVLVDGVERDFSNVDPEDIASFSVLKDASGTAVYGVRGANGVIIIETKKGETGKPKIKFQVNEGITQFTTLPSFADGVTYMKMANEAYKNSNPTSTMSLYSDLAIQKTGDGSDPDLYPNVNWIKELFKPAAQNRRVNMNVNGGSERAKYYLSLGYYNESGMYKADNMSAYNSSLNYNRYNFTSNLTLQMLKHTKLDFGASGWISDANYPGSSSSSIWNAAYVLPPISIPARYSNGFIAGTRQADVPNPYDLLTQTGYVTETRSQIWSNVRLTQDLSPLLKGLSLYGMFSFDNYNSHNISRKKTVDSYLATGRDANGNLVFDQMRIGSGYLGYDRSNGGNRQFYEEAALNYSNTFGKNEIGGLILYNQSDKVNAFAGDFISSIPTRYQGIASRATYSYDSKYMAEVNLGYNGSENFAKGQRFGLFPSIGAGWVASSEKFYKPLSNIIEFLKFRGSYGIVGNSNIGGRRFAYISTVNTSANNVYSFGQTTNNGYNGTDVGDYSSDVTWEKAKKLNLGIEMRALKGSLSLTVDLFKDNRTGIFLQRADLPQYVGVLNAPWGNLGEVSNKGIDATFSYNKKITKDLSVELRGNFTWNRAIVVNNASAPWPYPWQQVIGRKLGQRFGLTALGLFQNKDEIANSPKQTGDIQPGDIKYKDLNGDGKIDNYDAGPIGYGSMPEMVYGFGPSISYKGFAVGGWFKGISNVDISVGGEGFQPFSQQGSRGNLMSNITDRWTPENPGNNHVYPRLTYPSSSNSNYVGSTWWLRSGAFLRLQNVELSYTFQQKKLLKSIGLTNLRIYMIGYNMLTFSKFKEWDVELGDGKGANYPLTKSFNFGIECQL